jgi:N-acetylglucosaminyl-diphospho-decaprenol L-rhamnosyltransferase
VSGRDGGVEVAVVSHNSARWLPDCLDSLRGLRLDVALHVTVVDNASADGSADLVRADYPEVRLIASEANHGYARAVNRAARTGRGEYLLILNPDVRAHPDSVQVLLSHLEENPNVGLIAPRLLNPDGSLQYSCRRHYTMGTYLLRRMPLRRWFASHPTVRRHLMADWDHATVREVDWVLGAAMMVRRSALGTSIMDERYFLYFEDVDLCMRLQDEGWQVIYHPGAEMVHHHVRDSSRGFLNRGRVEHFKSWIKFQRKHAARASR